MLKSNILGKVYIGVSWKAYDIRPIIYHHLAESLRTEPTRHFEVEYILNHYSIC
jgi:hypothetical protein